MQITLARFMWGISTFIVVFFSVLGFFVDSNVFYMLFLALFFFLLSFIFLLNRVIILDDKIIIKFLHTKKTYNISSITSIRIYYLEGRYSFGSDQIAITFVKTPEVEYNISRSKLIKYCKNESIELYFIGYNKKLIKELKDLGCIVIKISNN